MRRIGPHQLLLTRLGQCFDVTGHIFRWNSHRPQAAYLQMGKVLADTLLVLQHIGQRRGDGAELRVVSELLENTASEFGDTGFE